MSGSMTVTFCMKEERFQQLKKEFTLELNEMNDQQLRKCGGCYKASFVPETDYD